MVPEAAISHKTECPHTSVCVFLFLSFPKQEHPARGKTSLNGFVVYLRRGFVVQGITVTKFSGGEVNFVSCF